MNRKGIFLMALWILAAGCASGPQLMEQFDVWSEPYQGHWKVCWEITFHKGVSGAEVMVLYFDNRLQRWRIGDGHHYDLVLLNARTRQTFGLTDWALVTGPGSYKIEILARGAEGEQIRSKEIYLQQP